METTKQRAARMQNVYFVGRKLGHVILGECEHEHSRKHKHHPDYSKPQEVWLLCPLCHQRLHAKDPRKPYKSSKPNNLTTNRGLKARIVERFGTQAQFAKALGMSESIVSEVVRGRRNLEESEQLRWQDLLGNTISFIEPPS